MAYTHCETTIDIYPEHTIVHNPTEGKRSYYPTSIEIHLDQGMFHIGVPEKLSIQELIKILKTHYAPHKD